MCHGNASAGLFLCSSGARIPVFETNDECAV